MNYFVDVLKKYAVFEGRASRKEYWMFFLFSVIFSFLLTVVEKMIGIPFLTFLYALAVLIPSLAVGARRLHDIGRTGWWLLINLIPFVGTFVLVIFAVQDSQSGANVYGPNPKGDNYVAEKTKVWTIVAICLLLLPIAMIAISIWGFIGIMNNSQHTRPVVNQTSTEPTGLIYGENYSYSLAAPKGWILDNKSGQARGLQAVFYKEGESWNTATVTMYTSTFAKKPNQSLDSVVKDDISNFKTAYPGLEVTDAPSIKTMDVNGAIAMVKYESNDTQGRYEAVAYIDSPNAVIMVVMDSKDKKQFEPSLPAFKDLVASYYYFTSNVNKQ